eukprot:SAG31_NODE_166_length_21670_cov_22.507719_3_plen_443_part_00
MIMTAAVHFFCRVDKVTLCHLCHLLAVRPSRSCRPRPTRGRDAESDGIDPFGTRRTASVSAGRDCAGWWMPEELLAGGLNANVGKFRCGDCALTLERHAAVRRESTQLPEAAAQCMPSTTGLVSISVNSHVVDVGPAAFVMGEKDSRQRYLAKFEDWNRSQPSWQHYPKPQAVLFTSDIHVDFPANWQWMEQLPQMPHVVLIVAGDICTSLAKLEDALKILASRFNRVFYCPGNHELWTSRQSGLNSIEKFFRILQICDSVPGVETRPAWVGSVAIIPIFSWYKRSLFGTETAALPLSDREKHFDAGCCWPNSIGNPHEAHDSLHDGIADFFLSCSAGRREHPAWPGSDVLGAAEAVITFSHFIPRKELYSGFHSMSKVMGCCEIDDEVRACHSTVHIFGHSHLPVDCAAGSPEIRYLQKALGYPRDWGGHRGMPSAVWGSI